MWGLIEIANMVIKSFCSRRFLLSAYYTVTCPFLHYNTEPFPITTRLLLWRVKGGAAEGGRDRGASLNGGAVVGSSWSLSGVMINVIAMKI